METFTGFYLPILIMVICVIIGVILIFSDWPNQSTIASHISLSDLLADASNVQKGQYFENRCARILSAKGFSVSVVGGSGDQGIDILARDPNSRKVVAQCKYKSSGSVGVAVLRDLHYAVITENAYQGIIFSSTKFTSGAEQFAEGKPLILIDGYNLLELEKEVGIYEGKNL